MFLTGRKKNQFGLGVDIGTKGIRIVENFKKKRQTDFRKLWRSQSRCSWQAVSLDILTKILLNPSVENIIRAIRAILTESEIETEKLFFLCLTLPLFPLLLNCRQ